MGTFKRSLLLKIFTFLAISAACIGLTACQFLKISSSESEQPHSHNFTHYDGKAATCTENGYKDYDVCSDCGYSTYEEIPAYGHTEVIDKGEPATCIKTGMSDGKHCSVCSTVLVKQEIIPVADHTPSDWIIDSEATYETSGSKHKECTVCHVTLETESIPAKKHSYGEWVITKKATCLEEGEKQRTCSDCGNVETQIIEKTTHTPSDWIIDKAATKEENGEKHKECTICGEKTDTAIIYATGSVGLRYSINDDGKTCSVTGVGTCTDTDICIPQVNPEGYTVTSIAQMAFYNCKNFTSITIPESLVSIGSDAFYHCSKMKDVYITSLEAWLNISGLDNLMGYYGLFALIFYGEKNLYLNNQLLTEITIPDNITSINDNAFFNCRNITSVTIPDSVTSIGNATFGRCHSLTFLNIPDSVTAIGEYTFYVCSSLTSITIPDSVTSIGSDAFDFCHSLKTVYYTGSAEDWDKISIGSDNNYLTGATRYYYSEKEPELNSEKTDYNGNYWHYDTDGKTPVIWKKEN